ncbi:MAG: hypothetical protein HYY20_04335 [Candidatus Tectomicrobia bacterium]|uniref:Uncharacterized protein n=1 Tax=Tectimicrobiota bacterium TaxID=2528274 RepID=A0A932FW39_UNCTE|nr:hypothetical protein [Candidatus Tectomicrobia bacterium]
MAPPSDRHPGGQEPAPGEAPPLTSPAQEGSLAPGSPAQARQEKPTPTQGKKEESAPGDQESQSTTTTSSGAQDPEEQPVVGLIGKVEVGRTSGSATAETPIVVPPGRNGLTPRLVLRYSSVGGPSPYGKGWQLELGRVVRSARRGVPRYDGTDGFQLFLPEGQMVELVTQTNESPSLPLGQFRWVPKVEEAFLRVVQDTGNNTWVVWDKGGTKFTFGGANAWVGKDTRSASGTFGWYLTRIQDPNGNTLQITYTAIPGGDLGSVAYAYPDKIHYGGNGDDSNPEANFPHKHHVTFVWDSLRPDRVESGTGGYLSRISQRLQKIEISTDGSNANRPFQTYELAYNPSPNGGQSLLASVTRTGVELSDGTSKSLPAVLLVLTR